MQNSSDNLTFVVKSHLGHLVQEDVSNFVISNFLIPFILILSSTDMVLSQVTVNNNNLSENTSIQCQQSDPPTTDTSVQEPSHDISIK
jgi:hypothetical protein